MPSPRLVITEPEGFPVTAKTDLQKAFDVVSLTDQTHESLQSALANAEGILIRLRHTFDIDVLKHAPHLRFIATSTTGLSHIDMGYVQGRGIDVLSLKGEVEFLRSIRSTAELAWGLLIGVIRRLPSAIAHVNNGDWNRDAFCGIELCGRTLGIVGCGRLGTMVAEYGRAFGMNVLVCDIRSVDVPEDVVQVSMEEVFERSDVVSIHVPATPKTEKLVSRDLMQRMKPGAILINTARGEVIDETALAEFLESGALGGAGLDVLSEEAGQQLAASKRLRQLAQNRPNILITPHIGGATFDAMPKAESFMVEKILRYWSATPEDRAQLATRLL